MSGAHGKINRTAAAELEKLAALDGPEQTLNQAILDGLVVKVELLSARAAWPAEQIAEHADRATLIVLRDDPSAGHTEAIGPLRWRCAKRLRRWAARVIVVGTEPQAVHFALAAVATVECGRLVFVQTSVNHADAWGRYLGRPDTTMVITPETMQ